MARVESAPHTPAIDQDERWLGEHLSQTTRGFTDGLGIVAMAAVTAGLTTPASPERNVWLGTPERAPASETICHQLGESALITTVYYADTHPLMTEAALSGVN